MNLLDEISQNLINDKNAFSVFMQEKLALDKTLLHKFFITARGKQQTILDYLITLHSKKNNLFSHIEWILQQGIAINRGYSLHLIFKLRKFELIPLFLPTLQRHPLYFESYDTEGKTLLFRALENKNSKWVSFFLNQGVNVNQPCNTQIQGRFSIIQPLDQAIISNLPAAIPLLLQAGAQLSNPCGRLRETPLLLAARLKRIDILKELLAHCQNLSLGNKKGILNAVNRRGHNAMTLLCSYLLDEKQAKEAIEGIAMLICHGMDAPLDPLLSSALRKYRHLLYQAIEKYSKHSQELFVNFLRNCHSKDYALHNVMYEKRSSSCLRYPLFKNPDNFAFKLEALTQSFLRQMNVNAREESPLFTEDEILFADFVSSYKQSMQTSCLFNPWSKMYYLITTGEITCWQHVMDYVNSHQDTRTEKILQTMQPSYPIAPDNAFIF